MTASAAPHTVELALRATEAYGRPDLGARLVEVRRRLLDPTVRVLVVGEFKQGKSQLINALVNAPVCPVDDDVATAVPTEVFHAEEPAAALVAATGRTPVPLDRLSDHVGEDGEPAGRGDVSHVEVGLPRQLLADGLVLVDTPGVGGLGSARAAATLAAVATADAVLFVSDAAQEYTAAELDFLRRARELCPNVACVLSKIDLYLQWRRIAELDREHLAAAGIPATLLAVSSELRLRAAAAADGALNAESGFPELVGFLRDQVVGGADQLARRAVRHHVLDVAEQLATSMRAELAAHEDPDRGAALVAELEASERRADELRKRSARWQNTLSDGVTDLIADIEYDLRDRMRQIVRDAEELIDEADPATIWEQFAAWLDTQVSSGAAANFGWACQRADWLARRVAEHFADGGRVALPDLRTDEADEPVERVPHIAQPDPERLGLGQKLLVGMRGSYGGMLMFGLLTSVAGMALLNPISIGAGVLIGGKTLQDERKRALQRRQADAKTAVRRHVDDVIFQLGKESKDSLRALQRTLRDHFAAEAQRLHTSLSESVQAARDAVQTDASQRRRRAADLRAELERLTILEERARALNEAPGEAS